MVFSTRYNRKRHISEEFSFKNMVQFILTSQQIKPYKNFTIITKISFYCSAKFTSIPQYYYFIQISRTYNIFHTADADCHISNRTINSSCTSLFDWILNLFSLWSLTTLPFRMHVRRHIFLIFRKNKHHFTKLDKFFFLLYCIYK